MEHGPRRFSYGVECFGYQVSADGKIRPCFGDREIDCRGDVVGGFAERGVDDSRDNQPDCLSALLKTMPLEERIHVTLYKSCP